MTGRDNREKAAQAEAMSQQGICTSQAAGPGAQEEPGQLSDSIQRQRKHRAKAAEKLRLRAESMQTAFAGMPGGQASSGAPVSAVAAAAQATTGAEAQKSARVSYGLVTSMAAVATGASKDVRMCVTESVGVCVCVCVVCICACVFMCVHMCMCVIILQCVCGLAVYRGRGVRACKHVCESFSLPVSLSLSLSLFVSS